MLIRRSRTWIGVVTIASLVFVLAAGCAPERKLNTQPLQSSNKRTPRPSIPPVSDSSGQVPEPSPVPSFTVQTDFPFRCQFTTWHCGSGGGRYGYWVLQPDIQTAEAYCKSLLPTRGDAALCMVTTAGSVFDVRRAGGTEFQCLISYESVCQSHHFETPPQQHLIWVKGTGYVDAATTCMKMATASGLNFCDIKATR